MKNERWEKIFYANSNQKTVDEAILLIDKIDLESETVTRGEKRISFIDKRVSPPKKEIHKHICIKHQSLKIYEANPDN